MSLFLSSNKNKNQEILFNKKQQGPKHLQKVALMCSWLLYGDK